MCGIIGYTGSVFAASKVVLDGLERLEYRGYDSAGLATIKGSGLLVNRGSGKLRLIRSVLEKGMGSESVAIGHTRWATHGKPTEENAHPHVDNARRIVVVHNGIIENYLDLKGELSAKGHRFDSQTDTEIIAHLLADMENPDFLVSFRQAVLRLEGAYALAVLHVNYPDRIFFARKNCPLIVGHSENEGMFLGSDPAAMLSYTRTVTYLNDLEYGYIDPTSVHLFSLNSGEPLPIQKEVLDWNPVAAEKGGYRHFMLKEIHEQPDVVRNTLGGRLDEARGKVLLPDFQISPEQFSKIDRIVITACGTAYYSGLVGKYVLERLCRIPVDAELASEFRYRDPVINEKTLVIAVSQSGETADTLAAIELARARGATTMAIVNVKGSSLTRRVDGTLYIHAGPEIGVASTKAYLAMVVGFELFALYLSEIRNTLSSDSRREFIHELKLIPGKIEEQLKHKEDVLQVAQKYQNYRNFLYLGRDYNYPTALEGALKLKELSYIHAEGYASGEMKHGPIALLDRDCPVVAILSESSVYEKVLSNIQEARARDCLVIGVLTEGSTHSASVVDDSLITQRTIEVLSPLLNVIPLQLFAYFVSDLKGLDVDQPRNLAKSVTVE
ncbi:MAG: glutamine--fructose-6-phosphate transaminase (isomerizing) [Candidatus Cloacimonetes bacterium]|nr:glutamine--fructose-6-phosphate transaminase (isomerizing) [Candidatus Cloacimonadota bacterium]